MDRGECFLRCGFPVTKRWRTGISIWQLLSFECLGKTDLCAATMAKSYESKLENRIVHTERLRSLGAKSPTFFHPSVFTIRKSRQERNLVCASIKRCFEITFFSQKMKFLRGICGLKGNPWWYMEWFDLFLQGFFPGFNGCLLLPDHLSAQGE